jgi:hypothetical protein
MSAPTPAKPHTLPETASSVATGAAVFSAGADDAALEVDDALTLGSAADDAVSAGIDEETLDEAAEGAPELDVLGAATSSTTGAHSPVG